MTNTIWVLRLFDELDYLVFVLFTYPRNQIELRTITEVNLYRFFDNVNIVVFFEQHRRRVYVQRILVVYVMIAENGSHDDTLVAQRIKEILTTQVQSIEIDVLAAIKQIPQLNHMVDAMLFKIGEKCFFVEFSIHCMESETIVSHAKVSITQYG